MELPILGFDYLWSFLWNNFKINTFRTLGFFVTQPCKTWRTRLSRNYWYPKMNQIITNKILPQANCPQGNFIQDQSQKRHVSYSRRDGHILETEEQLMSKYNCGYSALHKILVLKEGNIQFTRPYLWKTFNLNSLKTKSSWLNL